MGKTYRNWSNSESDKRNSREAKKYSKIKQEARQKERSKMKRDKFDEYEI